MTTPTKVLQVAASQLGYSRWNDPQSGSKYGRDYATRHGAAFGANGVPYCAMFVTWVLRQAGVNYPGGDFAYCPYGINNAVHAGRAITKTSAQPGDVIFFDWDGDGVSDHVGLVEVNRGSYVQTIEGNTSSGNAGSQSNGGGVYRRARSWSSVIAVTRPYYTEATVTKPATTGHQVTEDGYWGADTTRALQRYFGTPVDGVVSGQYAPNRSFLSACTTGWEWNNGDGSTLIRALQTRLGVSSDGYLGPNTVNALECHYGYGADRYLGAPSNTVRSMQHALNAGTF